MGIERGVFVFMVIAALSWASDAHVVEGKVRAKCSGKKVTVKGRVEAEGEWPATLRLELVDAQENVIASASDTVQGEASSRSVEGDRRTTTFQMGLAAPRGQKFQRAELAKARVRYSVIRARRQQSAGSEPVVEMCPKVARAKRWWERW